MDDNLTICVEAIDGLAIRRDQISGLGLVLGPPEIRLSYQEFRRLFAGREVSVWKNSEYEHFKVTLPAEQVIIVACRKIGDITPTKRVLE